MHGDFCLDPRDDGGKERPKPSKDIKKVKVGECYLKIGSGLTGEHKERLKQLLEKIDLFSWTIKDLPCIDPNFISHKLAVNLGAKPIVQARRRMGEKKDKVVQIETQKLLEGRFIHEIQYPT